MSTLGIATEALTPAGTAEYQQRHLQVVETAASIIVASEYQKPDYFNGLSGDEQIAFGD